MAEERVDEFTKNAKSKMDHQTNQRLKKLKTDLA